MVLVLDSSLSSVDCLLSVADTVLRHGNVAQSCALDMWCKWVEIDKKPPMPSAASLQRLKETLVHVEHNEQLLTEALRQADTDMMSQFHAGALLQHTADKCVDFFHAHSEVMAALQRKLSRMKWLRYLCRGLLRNLWKHHAQTQGWPRWTPFAFQRFLRVQARRDG